MYTVKPQVKRTYGSNSTKSHLSSSNRSDSVSSSLTSPDLGLRVNKRKRSLFEPLSTNITHPQKRLAKESTRKTSIAKGKALTQLHFIPDTSIWKTCSLCKLSYTKGVVDDEVLHKTHCMRVQKGLDWGKDEEREKLKANVIEIEDDAKLLCKEVGRIIAVPSNAGGKIGHKISTLLETINLSLSAPPLPSEVLLTAKAYLYLIPNTKGKENIVGCVVAQHITAAMEVADEKTTQSEPSLVHVDGGLYCKPQHLPTPLGIPRLFVSSAHRRKGIAQCLLNAAAKTFIHGVQLNPEKGEVAFSQPTSLGRTVMEKWGKGNVRIFEE